MAEEAYQKWEKTQGHGTWAEERATLVERSQGHTVAALLENGPGPATAPDAIVADKMKVEIEGATPHRVQEDTRMFNGVVEEVVRKVYVDGAELGGRRIAQE